MSKNRMNNILSKPDRGYKEPQGVKGALSALFRKILLDNNVTINTFASLMRSYLKCAQAKIPHNRFDISSAQGNLVKQLANKEMTWKTFIRGLSFSEVVKFDISVRLYKRHRPVTTHTITITLNRSEVESDDFLMEEEEDKGSDE